MVQAGKNAGFPVKLSPGFLLEILRQSGILLHFLDGAVPPGEALVGRQVDGAHPAVADDGQHTVAVF
jgi:hypothetical protein